VENVKPKLYIQNEGDPLYPFLNLFGLTNVLEFGKLVFSNFVRVSYGPFLSARIGLNGIWGEGGKRNEWDEEIKPVSENHCIIRFLLLLPAGPRKIRRGDGRAGRTVSDLHG
jgi:hypothetical protein